MGNRRKHKRYSGPWPARAGLAGGQAVGGLRDLSLGGTFFEGAVGSAVGDRIEIRVEVESEVLTGRVVGRKPDGVNVAFDGEEAVREAVRRLVERNGQRAA